MVASLITIATFDVMPSDEVFDAALNAESGNDEQEHSKFADIGMEANYMILNLGTMFLVFVIMLTIPACLICTKPCGRCWPWLDKKNTATATSLQGNAWIRFIMEGSLDIAICGSLNYIFIKKESGGLQWDTSFQVVNNLALIVLGIAVAAFPIWMMWFYCRNFKNWEDEEFEERYGAAFEGLKKDRRSAMGYPLIFMLRRFALVFVVTVGAKYLFLQLIVMVLSSVIQVAYLTTFQPSEEPLLLKLDLFNEITTITLVDMLVIFSIANPSPFDLEADIAFLSILFGNLAVHIFFLLKSTCLGMTTDCKRRLA